MDSTLRIRRETSVTLCNMNEKELKTIHDVGEARKSPRRIASHDPGQRDQVRRRTFETPSCLGDRDQGDTSMSTKYGSRRRQAPAGRLTAGKS